MSPPGDPLAVGVLVSGGGTNLQAIIDACAAGRIQARVAVVISDREDAFGLERARRAGIQARWLDPAATPGRDAYGEALAAALEDAGVGLVVLAGFMRILSDGFVKRFRGRCLNVHPSLLPRFRGLHPHRQALSAGVKRHGTSVHFVTEELDGGPVVLQAQIPVDPEDDERRLEDKVKGVEHVAYPMVIGWYAEGRLRMEGDAAVLDGERLTSPLRLEDLR